MDVCHRFPFTVLFINYKLQHDVENTILCSEN